ncbi:hypothetical protein ALC56_14451 [Trachymyrmex septentrionalis]|uniref:Uncharacterized protein n=1 Tax=Trachymyrmex septentrionalis TaxID=34720 RepID=A0A195ESI6_9HYME|nr:hypothetical protein ALC56_14451 [Trachymyrmex septentrionalis]
MAPTPRRRPLRHWELLKSLKDAGVRQPQSNSCRLGPGADKERRERVETSTNECPTSGGCPGGAYGISSPSESVLVTVGRFLYVFAVTSSWEQHAHMTDGRRRVEEKEEEKAARGCAAPRFHVFSPLRQRNLLRKCRRKINRNKSIEGNIKGFYVRTCVKRRPRRGEAGRGEARRHSGSPNGAPLACPVTVVINEILWLRTCEIRHWGAVPRGGTILIITLDSILKRDKSAISISTHPRDSTAQLVKIKRHMWFTRGSEYLDDDRMLEAQ